MQEYGSAFARVYDRHWGDFSERLAPVLTDLLGKDCGRMLDLCCGAGHLAAYMARRHISVVGLDASRAMLEHARERTRDLPVELVLADARNFRLEQQVDAVVSLYDALNHLPELDALSTCFGCVRAVLRSGGWFVFDLNTAASLRHWNGIWVDEDAELTLIRRGLYPDDRGRAWMRLSGFVHTDQGWERFSENVYNTPFRLEDVASALQRNGFSHVHFAVLPRLEEPVKDPETEKRVFVMAR